LLSGERQYATSTAKGEQEKKNGFEGLCDLHKHFFLTRKVFEKSIAYMQVIIAIYS